MWKFHRVVYSLAAPTIASMGYELGSWNFSGLCSQRKQKEVSEVLNKLKLDIVAVQESWEKKGSVIEVQGYKWLGIPRKIQNSKRGREVLDS